MAAMTGRTPLSPGPDPRGVSPHVLAQGLGDDLGRQLGPGGFRRCGEVGRLLGCDAGHVSCLWCLRPPLRLVPPVVMYSTTVCRSNFEASSWTTNRPRYRTAIRSATSKTSVRLCEMTITARPRSRRRLMRSSTCLVCTTPRAAVGSSMITSFEFHITALATATDWRWPPDSEATGWRIDRTVVTRRLASVSARGALHAVLVQQAAAARARGRGTCSARCRGCRPGRGPGRRSRCRGGKRRARCGRGPGDPPRRPGRGRAGRCRRCILVSTDLPAPLSPHSAVTLPGREVEVDVVQRLDRTEVLVELPDLEQRLGGRRRRLRRRPSSPCIISDSRG